MRPHDRLAPREQEPLKRPADVAAVLYRSDPAPHPRDDRARSAIGDLLTARADVRLEALRGRELADLPVYRRRMTVRRRSASSRQPTSPSFRRFLHGHASGREERDSGDQHNDRRGPAEPAGELAVDMLAHDRSV